MYTEIIINDLLILSIMILIAIILIFIVTSFTSQIKEGFRQFMETTNDYNNFSQ